MKRSRSIWRLEASDFAAGSLSLKPGPFQPNFFIAWSPR